MFQWIRNRRRARNAAQPFPATWEAILASLPVVSMLPERDGPALRALVQQFIAEKNVEGCRGLAVTDEMRVTVAAQACLLLLGREHDLFPHIQTVLLYPSAYVARHTEVHEGGIEEQREDVMLGESWERGNVVLSWEDVALDAQHPDDGFNVVLHEFAHQLDAENGSMDGAPLLPRAMQHEWASVMGAEYEALCKFADSLPPQDDEDAGMDPAFDERRERQEGDWVIDPYGAEDPSEFFAVSVEAFFENARALRQRHPLVYELLAQYFRREPIQWR